jgi:DNA-binding Xre family transcriptional regulator
MLPMRFTLPELVRAKGIDTAYRLSKRTGSAIPISTAARLMDPDHPPTRIDFRVLEALCRVLEVGPNELLATDDGTPWPTPKKPRRRSPSSP